MLGFTMIAALTNVEILKLSNLMFSLSNNQLFNKFTGQAKIILSILTQYSICLDGIRCNTLATFSDFTNKSLA